ncbi:MAG: serpin family protein [Tannerella sp.]|jgi:serpin B|nr:serpin family protein [Tannerella sp.]
MKKSTRLTVLLSFIGLFIACESDDNIDNNQKLPDAEPIELRLSEKVKTDNQFAVDLFKTTYKSTSGTNVFISPLSVSMALNMTLNGAVDETGKEMLEALRASDYSIDQINEYSQSLRKALLEVDPSTELTIANSIWYDENLSVKNDFIAVNTSSYNAEVNAIDFLSPDAATQINNWCAKQTNDKIPEIIENVSGVMYLINAIYFKGIWVAKFDKSNTRKEAFFQADGQKVQVDMMRQTDRFNYSSDENCGYLELPYGNNAFSMILMLPHEGKTTDDVVRHLDNDSWQITNAMRGREVNIRLPRFKMECEYKMQDDILPAMGMKIPFTKMADFSGISDAPLFISKVVHKTFVEVNEEGTEAAAATSVEMELSAGPVEIIPIDYFVNKPFLFAIRENSTGAILFFGNVIKI